MVNIIRQNTMRGDSNPVLKSNNNMRRPFRDVNRNIAKSTEKSTATKPQANPLLKSRPEPQGKLSLASENTPVWSSIDKEMSSQDTTDTIPSIFRRRSDVDDDDTEDMFVLKRANPVYDSEDEDEFSTPSKRQRKSEPETLHWDNQMSDDELGSLFTFSF
mmetsp:Transcript_36007/g.103561  ORF Transcript_36007/g.103561 Transcript_36007/m.103561 type:complete len:160 (-) Transcript_36007:10-489(-)